MGTFQTTARNKAKNARKPSNKANATVNRAGGVAFEVSDPALKLVTMTGGSFFAEPKFYNGDAIIPKRIQGGKFEDLARRLEIVDGKLKGFASCEELNDVAREVVATAIDVGTGDNPEDLLAIANWLRNEMNIRLTPQVLLVVASKLDQTKTMVRRYAPHIIKRPDEVKTCLLVHRFFFGMKSLPNGLNLGLGDALSNVGEYGLMKYDSPNFPTWKDVLGWVKRKGDWPVKKPVADYFIAGKVPAEADAPIVAARAELNRRKTFDNITKELARKSRVNWEVLLSQFGDQKKAVWEFLIDEKLLGYMAMLRNLRNILQAGVSREHVAKVSSFISSKAAVEKSKQLPFRFLSAVKALEIGDVDQADRSELEAAAELAINYAAENIGLPGTTAIFVDASGSMTMTNVSEKSTIRVSDAANVLCGIVAKGCERAYVYEFATDVREVRWAKTDTVLDVARKISFNGVNGHNTNAWKIPEVLKEKGIYPDRVIILSDLQCWNDTSMTGSGGYRSYNSSSEKAVCDTWSDYVKSGAKNTWLHCVHLNGSGDTIVDEGAHVNQVSGFSEKIFGMLAQTEGLVEGEDGESVALPTVDQIRNEWRVNPSNEG